MIKVHVCALTSNAMALSCQSLSRVSAGLWCWAVAAGATVWYHVLRTDTSHCSQFH